MINFKQRHLPYWSTLKFILSSLIVFNYYLNLDVIYKYDFLFLINIFNITLIPMFVFIAAFITKDLNWQSWRQNLISSLIIYVTFQTIDALSLYFNGKLTLNIYLFFPQYGVWFFLATPIWQLFFLLLPLYIKNNRVILFFILIVSLFISWLTTNYLIKISTFFYILYYFPYFIMAYFFNEKQLLTLRRTSIFKVLLVAILMLVFLYYQNNIDDFIISRINNKELVLQFVRYVFEFLISVILGAFIIYFSLSTRKYANVSNYAQGIYLIHPIVCFVILKSINIIDVKFNLLLIIILTMITITVSFLLALNPIVGWLIKPVLNFNKLKHKN